MLYKIEQVNKRVHHDVGLFSANITRVFMTMWYVILNMFDDGMQMVLTYLFKLRHYDIALRTMTLMI